MAGIASDENLIEEIVLSYMGYLEQSWRHCRAVQGGRGKAFVVVDLAGLSMSHIANVGIIKRISSIGPPRYPETTAGVALVNGPWVLTAIFKIISPLLPENTRKKIQILGGDFLKQLKEKIEDRDIPTYLGGKTWVGEHSSHKAAALNRRSMKVDRKALVMAIKAEANKEFVIEAQDEDIDLDEMPGGFRRFGAARNSVSLTKEEMQKYKNSLKDEDKDEDSEFQIKKADVSEEDLMELPEGKLRFTGARNSILVTKSAIKETKEKKKGSFGFFGKG